MRASTEISDSALSSAPGAPTLLSRSLGVVLGLFTLLGAFVAGLYVAHANHWAVFAEFGVALLLIVAAWTNSPLLWNAVGRMMRRLLGERTARVYFAFTGVALVFGGLMAAWWVCCAPRPYPVS